MHESSRMCRHHEHLFRQVHTLRSDAIEISGRDRMWFRSAYYRYLQFMMCGFRLHPSDTGKYQNVTLDCILRIFERFRIAFSRCLLVRRIFCFWIPKNQSFALFGYMKVKKCHSRLLYWAWRKCQKPPDWLCSACFRYFLNGKNIGKWRVRSALFREFLRKMCQIPVLTKWMSLQTTLNSVGAHLLLLPASLSCDSQGRSGGPAVLVFYSLTAALTAVFVLIERRHLMVWAIFAPKLVWDFATLLAVDAIMIGAHPCIRDWVQDEKFRSLLVIDTMPTGLTGLQPYDYSRQNAILEGSGHGFVTLGWWIKDQAGGGRNFDDTYAAWNDFQIVDIACVSLLTCCTEYEWDSTIMRAVVMRMWMQPHAFVQNCVSRVWFFCREIQVIMFLASLSHCIQWHQSRRTAYFTDSSHSSQKGE